MNVLVTGATGFLGSRLLEELCTWEYTNDIIATGRTKKSNSFTHSKIKYKLGDLTDKTFVMDLLSGIDCIVHAAALSSPWGSHHEFKDANVRTIENIIEVSIKLNVNRIVFISSPSIYFKLDHQFDILETDPLPNPINEYAKTKRMAEIILSKSGIDYVILRPRALIGRGDTVIIPRLIRAHRSGRLSIIGDGTNCVDLTPVGNVVDAILLSLRVKGEGLNQIYNISNGNPVKLWDKIHYVFESLNFPLTLQHDQH
ncbi:MAG TPA: NAD(P)-dependent oxidoreductase, partial [Flavobacteriales bacterium]|nr:NAD(P)-dependent oxidoreductase [Flavobacteriales bacterium]